MDRASGFLLSMLSPVWRAKLCGDVGGESRRQLDLAGEEASAFKKLLALGSGAAVTMDGGVEQLVALGRMADRYQVEVVQSAVEDAVVSGHLTVGSCGSILMSSFGSGLERVARTSRELALREFDEFSKTAGFMGLSEEVLGSLLDDDGLTMEKEERVYEGLVRWMNGGDGEGVRGERLLRKIRFPFMDGKYLAAVAGGLLPTDVGLDGLLLDSYRLNTFPCHEWAQVKLRFLDASVLVQRGKVIWEKYEEGGERRLAAGQWVYSVAACGGYVCGGLHDDSILVWSMSTLEQGRTLTGHTDHSILRVGGGAAHQRIR